jgi:ribose/xylose/arabinose/galactoside ABC-type transport system permease subunit
MSGLSGVSRGLESPRDTPEPRERAMDATPAGIARPGRGRRPGNLLLLAVLLLIVVVAGAWFVPTTMQSANLANVARMTAIVGIVALGQMLVMLSGEIDLSLGSVMSLSLVAGGLCLDAGSGVALAVTACTGVALGLVNGFAVTFGRVASLIVTLATMSVFAGLANIAARGQAKYLYGLDAYLWVGKGSIAGLPVPAALLLVLCAVVALALVFTTGGRALQFVGSNAVAAWYSGLSIRRVKIAAFAVAGLFASLAGPMLASQTNRITPTLGTGFELSAIAIAVLGGTALDGGRGSPLGTLLGAAVFGMLLNILALSGIGTYLEQVLKGVLLIVVVAALQAARRGARDD